MDATRDREMYAARGKQVRVDLLLRAAIGEVPVLVSALLRGLGAARGPRFLLFRSSDEISSEELSCSPVRTERRVLASAISAYTASRGCETLVACRGYPSCSLHRRLSDWRRSGGRS